MTGEEIKDYTLRITQTNRTGLVVITYEIINNYIDAAINAVDAENKDIFKYNCRKARQFVNELSSSLDFQYKISFDLMSLYLFANDCLLKSELKQKNVHLESIRDMINKLKASFEKISNTDDTGKVMMNTQHVYEGLTYGRDAKNNVNVTGRDWSNHSI